MSIRVGFGFDVHQLKIGHPFYLGGVLLDHSSGAFGHSDADVLIHAMLLLERVRVLIQEKGWKVANMDTSICLEAPKIQAHVPRMQILIAKAAGVDPEAVSIKATTNEKMGFIGRQEGLTAYAVVLLEK